MFDNLIGSYLGLNELLSNIDLLLPPQVSFKNKRSNLFLRVEKFRPCML